MTETTYRLVHGPAVEIVRLSEMGAAGSYAPRDFVDGPVACDRCGFAPRATDRLLRDLDDGRSVCLDEVACLDRLRSRS